MLGGLAYPRGAALSCGSGWLLFLFYFFFFFFQPLRRFVNEKREINIFLSPVAGVVYFLRFIIPSILRRTINPSRKTKMHLSNLVLLPLALLPLVTADSDSGEGSWSIRGSKSKDKPDLYDDLASGRNTVVCGELSNGEELSFVKGTPGDFVVTVYEGFDNDDNKKCLGEGANIQPGKVYEGPWKHYEVSPFFSSSFSSSLVLVFLFLFSPSPFAGF